MHIVLLANALSIHTIRWANKLSEMGNEITVISCKDHSPENNQSVGLNDSVKIVSLQFSSLRGIGYFLNAFSAKRVLKILKPDVINSHYASGYGTLARVANAQPSALSVWGSDIFDFPNKSIVHKLLVISNLKHADLIMSTSSVMAEKIREVMKDATLKIPITPFGVDIEKFKVVDIKDTGNSTVTIGIVKSLKSIYGIQNLIEAASLVREQLDAKQGVGFEIHIYGDGPYRDELESLVQKCRVGDVVFFHGSIPNQRVPEILSKLDIYVLPSIHESFGVAAVEAMAAGLPVVASNAPGLMEVIDDGISGIRFRAGDSQQLASALVSLIVNPDLRIKLGQGGRKQVEKKFVFDDNARILMSGLESIGKR